MPIKKAAKKAVLQSLKRKVVNVEFKESMKTAIKAVKKAIDAKTDNVADLVIFAQKRVDKASKRNIISKESASRKKSILMRSMNAAGISLPTSSTPATPVKKPRKTAKKDTE